jgi:hypothetical protein
MKTTLLALAVIALAFGFSLDVFKARIALIKGWFHKSP